VGVCPGGGGGGGGIPRWFENVQCQFLGIEHLSSIFSHLSKCTPAKAYCKLRLGGYQQISGGSFQTAGGS